MMVRNIQINGVGFNADAVLKMGKDNFIAAKMHNNHWLHLPIAKRKEAIVQAWEIIYNRYGITDINDRSLGAAKGIAAPDGKKRRSGNKRKLPEPERNPNGDGVDKGGQADNSGRGSVLSPGNEEV